MRVLIISSSIIDCLGKKDDPAIIAKIMEVFEQSGQDKIIALTQNGLPVDLNKYGIEIETVHVDDFFERLREIGKNFQDLALFLVMHNGDNSLVKRYLKSKNKTKICFFDISQNIDDFQQFAKDCGEDATIVDSALHSKPTIYRYRNLKKSKSLPNLKIYELPWVNVH